MTYALLRWLVLPKAYRKIRSLRGLEHIPERGGFLLVANHVSWLDPVYLIAAATRRYRGRVKFIAATGKHRWTQAVIPIDKTDRVHCLRIAVQELKQGRAIGIFPRGDQRQSASYAKTGAARLAHWSGVPLIPVAIKNLVPGHTFSSIFEYFRNRRSIEMSIGTPMRFRKTEDISHEELHADMFHVESAITTLLSEL